MRILVIIHEFPPIGGGGGRAAYDICKNLAARGHEVVVLTAHFYGLARGEIIDGIRVIRIPSFRKESFAASFITMLAFVLAGLWTGLRLIRSYQPDIIHTHFAVPAGAIAWVLSLFTGVPYILTIHLGDVPGGVPEKTEKWFRWLKPFTYPIWRRAKKVIAVSEHTRQLAIKQYPVDVQVIHNGAEHFSTSEVRVNSIPRIIFAGRFVSQKNPLAIVQTLSQIKDLAWVCSMLGDGPLFESVKQEIEKNDLTQRFHMPGWVTPEDVLEHFSTSDILFMPSLSEGLPVTGVQALTSGLAIVASRIGGFLDLVENEKNGYLIEVDNISAFSASLRELISNPKTLLQFRRSSIEKSRDFDIQKVVDQYQLVLQASINKS